MVIPGSRPKEFPAGSYGLPCGLIIGYRDEDTDDKVRLNELLREHGVVDELMSDRHPPRGTRSRPPLERQVLESPLSATWRPAVREKAVLVGVGPGIAEEDLDELAALADSAGAEAVARVVQSRPEPDPATFIGKGKLDDLHATIHAARRRRRDPRPRAHAGAAPLAGGAPRREGRSTARR